MGKWGRYGIGAAIVIAIVIAGLVLPLNRWALLLVEWVHGAGWLGVVVYGLAYILATLLLIPGSVLTLGAGFVYGPVWGTLFVSPVSVLSATLAFLLGRSVLRGWISRRMQPYPRFAAIDEAVSENSFKVVLLLRLSPIFPFNLLNYGLGLTGVRLRDYVIASFLGMLPGTLLYVYLGSLVINASELLSGSGTASGGAGDVLYWSGFVAVVVLTVVATRIARTALRQTLATGTPPAQEGADVIRRPRATRSLGT
jgi:uncharacterized membrane protein YdjX (TVP38/TMEM64 family)